MKKLSLLGAILGLCFLFAACVTNQKGGVETRKPAASRAEIFTTEVMNYIEKDEFAKDGMNHNGVSGYTARKFQDGMNLSPDQEIKELAGREIWFKSAPNERFHTYYFSQKLNSPIAWNDVLRGDIKHERFQRWGLIPDPDCCTPGSADCAKIGLPEGASLTFADTYGWEYCKGDKELLAALKRDPKSWKDPACNHPIIKAADALDSKPRENRCELAFGTPTGAVGIRKFPNPRFNKNQWRYFKGWQGYEEERMKKSQIDASIEPPFRVAISCASCHGAYDPLNAPADLNKITWKNIKGETGNQYSNFSAILGSGTKRADIEHQLFMHGRAGTVDTSAVPNDGVNNPGTINALINIDQRPKHEHNLTWWKETDQSCSGENCQTITYDGGGQRHWKKVTETTHVRHILKGGEDSVGDAIALQRVYLNIGLCAEQCWVNHLTNLREMDSSQRGFGQTPFDIKQCRRDCAGWRANEDRIGDLASYITSRRPTDLKDAIGAKTDAEFERYLDKRYGTKTLNKGLVAEGKKVFMENCVSCHSSQNISEGMDFKATEVKENGEIVRKDWMGSDKRTEAKKVGTYYCRSQHSNHMKGHVWDEFSSNTYKRWPSSDENSRGMSTKGGRGYYRNLSLLNAWAHAPFMHNNAVGPEICGVPTDKDLLAKSFWRTTVEGKQIGPNKNICDAKFDPSVEGRLDLFDASMDELLSPNANRIPKVGRVDEDIILPLGADIGIGRKAVPLTLKIPKGIPNNLFGSFDIKAFVTDMRDAYPFYLEIKKGTPGAEGKYNDYWDSRIPDGTAADELARTSLATFAEFTKVLASGKASGFKKYQESILAGDNERAPVYMKYYSNCLAEEENFGHEIGVGIDANKKAALKAFMATL